MAAFNVHVNNSDSLSGLALANIEALAEDRENTSGKKTGSYDMFDCDVYYVEISYDSDGKKIKGKATWKKVRNAGYNCDFKKEGNCTEPKICPIGPVEVNV